MFQASYTRTKGTVPDIANEGLSQNGQVLFPQQASLFYAGRIAPKLGGFIQLTYSSDSGNIALDNTDIRRAPAGRSTSAASQHRGFPHAPRATATPPRVAVRILDCVDSIRSTC
jgi:hypothetical protein